ncbi:MAG: acyclic terpene utilization AtuA family protein [Isosphaeraceae bacterium]
MFPATPHPIGAGPGKGSGDDIELPARARRQRSAGFWDNLDAPYLLARDGGLDVLTLEYLAELTLAILAHLRAKDASAGYVTDFPDLLQRLQPILADQAGPTIVTNAGGLNWPPARKSGAILVGADRGDTPIGVVSGDDLPRPDPLLIQDGVALDHMETGESIATVVDRLVAANAYLGRPANRRARPGGQDRPDGPGRRCLADLGPAASAFGWDWDDWAKLAGASTAGHLIECGAQATGGLWRRWDEVPDLANIGYPIAELSPDGSCTLTKPAGTGGFVHVANVAEQLLYEVEDPACYRTPDVDVDLTTVQLEQDGDDRVRVSGASGNPPSDRLKVSAIYRDGWMASGFLAVVGRDAETRARAAGRIVLERVKRAGFDLAASLVECLGAGDVVPGVIRPESPPREVVLRVTVRDPRRSAVQRFCKEMAPLVTAGPPGIAGYASGRPEARPAFGYFPMLIPRSMVEPICEVRSALDWAREEAGE